MKQIMFDGEPINVLSATGYHDGYYWDMNATVEFRGNLYSMYDAGSGSGYIPNCCAIQKGPLDRLYGTEQGDIDEDEWDYLESTIEGLIYMFIVSGAEESFERLEDDYFEATILVDGVEKEVDWES